MLSYLFKYLVFIYKSNNVPRKGAKVIGIISKANEDVLNTMFTVTATDKAVDIQKLHQLHISRLPTFKSQVKPPPPRVKKPLHVPRRQRSPDIALPW